MRITDNMRYGQVQRNLANLRSRQLQHQAATELAAVLLERLP